MLTDMFANPSTRGVVMALVQRFIRRFVLILAALVGGVFLYSLATGGDPDFESPETRAVMHWGGGAVDAGE